MGLNPIPLFIFAASERGRANVQVFGLTVKEGGKVKVELITKEDLEDFKIELLRDLKELLNGPAIAKGQRLKSADVPQLLGISPRNPAKSSC